MPHGRDEIAALRKLILLVEQRGIEPLTSALRTRRSAKLSYCPTSKFTSTMDLRSCL